MKRLKTWFRRLRTLLWTALAMMVIGAAVLVGVGKLLMPYSERYKPRLEAVLSEQFNQPVRVESFTGEWKAFGPRISLEGVTLLGAAGGEDALAIQHAALDVKPLNALLRGRPLYSFRIIGADLALVRFADGRLELSGLGLSGRRLDQGGSGGFRNLARLGEVRLQDSRFRFSDPSSETEVQLRDIDGRLQLSGARMALDLKASVSDGPGRRVLGDLAATVLADLDEASRPEQVEFHLETGELMVEELAAYLPDHALSPTSGRVNAQLWGSWNPGRGLETAGVVDLRDAGVDTGERQLLLDHLNARLNWRWRDKTQWRIDLADVRVSENGRDWIAPSIAVERNLPGNLGVWVSADYLQAEFPLDVTQLIMKELGRRWPKAAPTAGRGPVSDFDLVINANRKLAAVSGRFEDLEVLEWGRWPLVSGLSGDIDLAFGEGSLRIAGENVLIRWDRNFRAPLLADLPGCELEILWDETDHWQVDALPCPLRSEHIEAEGRLRFVRDEDKPRVDVNVHVARAELGQLAAYWPASLMKPPVIDWLTRSIEAARVTDARFLLQGDMDRFPFRNGEGSVRLTAAVEEARLAYAEGWPVAEAVVAGLEVDGARLVLDGRIGTLAGGAVQAATVRIPDLQQPVLELSYRSETDLPALAAFVDASPLLDRTALDLARFDLEGDAVTSGRLVLPLGSSPGDPALAGRLVLAAGALEESESAFRLENIAGEMTYGLEGASADGLASTLSGWPAQLDLAADWGTERPFEATLSGRFPMSVLAALTPLDDDPLLRRARGEAAWTLRLDARREEMTSAGATSLWIEAGSDLVGVTLDLPAPLDKPAEAAWPFSLSYPLRAPAPVMRATLSDRLSLAFAFSAGDEAEDASLPELSALDAPPVSSPPAQATVVETVPDLPAPRLVSGAVSLGGVPAGLPRPGVFRLGGRAGELDLDGWLRVVIDYAAADRYPGGLAFETAGLAADRLLLLNRAFDDVRLALDWQDDALEADIEGEAIDGSVRYRRNEDGNHALAAQLERLWLPDPVDADRVLDTNPTDLPEMRFYIGDLRFMGLNLGQTRIEAFPIANGLRFETVDAASEQLTFQARGEWVNAGQGSRSDFDIVLTSESLGALVNALELSSVLEGGQTMVRYDAWWPGPPNAFELARLNGQMSFSVIDGRILNADPGAGRVLGLMSVGALPRRLALDFTDVFETGFGFDQANGTLRLDSGVAYTDDFVMESTAARLAITGSSDLEAQVFDYLITVRPGVSQALPVIGAIAAGPAGAAAGLALQGLLRDALGEAAEARYQISGPWSEPEVERLPATPPDAAPDNATAQTQTTENP